MADVAPPSESSSSNAGSTSKSKLSNKSSAHKSKSDRWSISNPLRTLAYNFPLISYEPQGPIASPLPPAPQKPTLWILSPRRQGSSSSSSNPISFDLDSLRHQALLLFSGVQVVFREWKSEDAGIDGKLPTLHLPNGDLIGAKDLKEWVKNNGESGEVEESQADESKVWESLVETKLRAALLQLLFRDPDVYSTFTSPFYHPLTHPSADGTSRSVPLPTLTRFAVQFQERSHRSEALAEIQRLSKAGADSEEVENQGVEAIRALADKFGKDRANGWFLGSSPTPVDSAIFACVHIILSVPSKGLQRPALRKELEQHPNLLGWHQSVLTEYFGQTITRSAR